MIVVYIAGPYRAPSAWLRELNIRDAETKALEVAAVGLVPLCPHTMTRYFDGTLSDDFWLRATAELLRRCDAAIFLPGWELSTGSRAEREQAERDGIPVFDSLVDLIDWADRRVAEKILAAGGGIVLSSSGVTLGALVPVSTCDEGR